jgi:dienelactone hydrolase
VILCAVAAAFTPPVLAQMKAPPLQVAEPGKTGRRITEDGLVANYYPAGNKSPAVLVLGGSEGGLSVPMSRITQSLHGDGFSVMQLSYFRAPGQSPKLEMIPLEYFAKALQWMVRQPEVDAQRLAILGMSRGAEGSLLVATRRPELKAVVAAMPSSVLWAGVSWEDMTFPPNAWSEGGKPLPNMPNNEGFTVALDKLAERPQMVIPVERIAGEVLLVCGEADTLWPGCRMARQVESRAREHKRPRVTVLAYPDAGHFGFGPPLADDAPGLPSLAAMGGTPEGNNAARKDGWEQTKAFLRRVLK